MLKKLLLILPIISSLALASPAGALTIAENLKALDDINKIVAQLAAAVAEIRQARQNQINSFIGENDPAVQEAIDFLGFAGADLDRLQNSLRTARGVSSRGNFAAEISSINSALRNATALLVEAQKATKSGVLGDSFRNPAQKIINIIEGSGLPDLLRQKLNALSGAVGIRYSLRVSGHNKDVAVTLPNGQSVVFKPGENYKQITLSSRLPSSASVGIRATDGSFSGSRAVVVSRASSRAGAPPNCSADARLAMNLNILSGSAIISGASVKWSVDEERYKPEFISLGVNTGGGAIFENNRDIPAAAKDALRQLPAGIFFTHTGGLQTAKLYLVSDAGRARGFSIYSDSASNFSSYYDRLGLKNLKSILLLGKLAANPTLEEFFAKFTNLTEDKGYPVLFAREGNKLNILAKNSAGGSYQKFGELAAGRGSIAYASKNGQLNIVVSANALNRGSVERLIGGLGVEKAEHRLGAKWFNPGLITISPNVNSNVSAGLGLLNIALAQEESEAAGTATFGVDASSNVSAASAPAPSQDALTGAAPQVSGPNVTPPTGVSTGGGRPTGGRPARAPGFRGEGGFTVTLPFGEGSEGRGVDIGITDGDLNELAIITFGGQDKPPACGKDFKTPGLDVAEPTPEKKHNTLDSIIERGESRRIETPSGPSIYERFRQNLGGQIETGGAQRSVQPPSTQAPGIFDNIRNIFR